MNNTILLICSFASVAALGYFISSTLFGDGENKLRSRLEGKSSSANAPAKQAVSVRPLLQQIGQVASRPFMPSTREKQGVVQKQLNRAGIYNPASIRTIQGAKFISLSLGLILGYCLSLFMESPMICLSLGGLVGYVIPKVWLTMLVSANQRALDVALPDALDLMVVCVEAGLTIDAAMQRVGEELSNIHPSLSQEFGITQMQMRVGMARSEALKTMGLRTSNAALLSLAAMLNQADRFGTSIGQALRVHSESMRIARQHKAEEQAAKCSVKMSFPLVFFIFPATFIVLMGPVVMQLMASPLMK